MDVWLFFSFFLNYLCTNISFTEEIHAFANRSHSRISGFAAHEHSASAAKHACSENGAASTMLCMRYLFNTFIKMNLLHSLPILEVGAETVAGDDNFLALQKQSCHYLTNEHKYDN